MLPENQSRSNRVHGGFCEAVLTVLSSFQTSEQIPDIFRFLLRPDPPESSSRWCRSFADPHRSPSPQSGCRSLCPSHRCPSGSSVPAGRILHLKNKCHLKAFSEASGSPDPQDTHLFRVSLPPSPVHCSPAHNL